MKATFHFLLSTEAWGAPLLLLAQNADGRSSLLRCCFQLIHSRASVAVVSHLLYSGGEKAAWQPGEHSRHRAAMEVKQHLIV